MGSKTNKNPITVGVCPFAISANIEAKDNKPSKTKGDYSMYEGRLAKVEVMIEHIEKDIREIRGEIKSNFLWVLGIFGAGFLLLSSGLITILGVMAHGLHWI